MPSPFPGMDPYLEAPRRWPDVHQRLITYIADALQPAVRPHYHARMGERVYILNPLQAIVPDVSLLSQRRPDPGGARVHEAGARYVVPVLEPRAPAQAETDEPVRFIVLRVEQREPCVEIVHGDGEVVTVIEVLGPANKTPGEGHQQYRRKQEQILNSPVHFVEIDLLAAGLATVAIPAEDLLGLPPHRYTVTVRRGPELAFEVYPVPPARRLPRVRIPLRAPDPDVRLDLQAVFDRAYDNGGYADLVDYTQPPSTPLSDAEAAWLAELLREKGLRP